MRVESRLLRRRQRGRIRLMILVGLRSMNGNMGPRVCRLVHRIMARRIVQHLRICSRALLHRARRYANTIRLVDHMRPHLRKLLQLIFKLFKILIVLPLLIAIGVLKQIRILVEVVLREHSFRLYLIVVRLRSHLL